MQLDQKVRRGETLDIGVLDDDTTIETVRIVVWDSSDDIKIDEPFTFTNGEATISLDIDLPIATYSYLLQFDYSDGKVDIIPDPDGCNGECAFPTIEVCPGVPEGS